MQADLHPIDGKIGIGRIADDNIAQHLPLSRYPLDAVGCGQVQRGKLVVDDVGGDRFS